MLEKAVECRFVARLRISSCDSKITRFLKELETRKLSFEEGLWIVMGILKPSIGRENGRSCPSSRWRQEGVLGNVS